MPDCTIHLRDITQAYTQSKSSLQRSIFAHLPREVRRGYPQESIMEIVNPLYGIADAGTHWSETYSTHHRENLALSPSSNDPCLMISTSQQFDITIDTSSGCGLTILFSCISRIRARRRGATYKDSFSSQRAADSQCRCRLNSIQWLPADQGS